MLPNQISVRSNKITLPIYRQNEIDIKTVEQKSGAFSGDLGFG